MKADLHLDLLDRVSVASPCPAPWEDMVGDDRVRHCGACGLSVHNLSAMTRVESAMLLKPLADGQAGRVCVQFYRRADGTILTRDCPDGMAAAVARVRSGARRLTASLVTMISAGLVLLVQASGSRGPERVAAWEPFASLRARLNPTAAPMWRGARLAGACAIAPPRISAPKPAPAPSGDPSHGDRTP